MVALGSDESTRPATMDGAPIMVRPGISCEADGRGLESFLPMCPCRANDDGIDHWLSLLPCESLIVPKQTVTTLNVLGLGNHDRAGRSSNLVRIRHGIHYQWRMEVEDDFLTVGILRRARINKHSLNSNLH